MTKDSVKNLLRNVVDFPKAGVNFKDISPVLNHPPSYRYIVHNIVRNTKLADADIVLGLDARGFILGPMIADRLNIGFGMIRKAGKLPPPYIVQEYDLEYGHDILSASPLIITKGLRCHIHDDLLASGNSALTAINLVEKLGGIVVSLSFICELDNLKGIEKLKKYNVYSFLKI